MELGQARFCATWLAEAAAAVPLIVRGRRRGRGWCHAVHQGAVGPVVEPEADRPEVIQDD